MWGDKVRLRFKGMINQCRYQIVHLKRLRSAIHDAQIIDVRQKLHLLLIQEEKFWKLRAKIFWLKRGC